MTLPQFSESLQQEAEEHLLQKSSLKPLYFTSISVDGEKKLRPLSDATYNSVLEPVLSQPLQTLEQSLANFTEIKKKLIYTGMFSDVKISLDKDTSGNGLKDLHQDAIKELSLESPVPTIARILLKPLEFNKLCFTSSTNDTVPSLGARYSFVNALGKAEIVTLQSEVKYIPFKNTALEKTLDAKVVVPLQKNPSVKAVFDTNYANIDLHGQPFVEKKDQHRQRQVSVNVGVQKQWLTSKMNLSPVFYNGFSVVARNLHDVPNEASGAIRQFNAPFLKNSFVSQLVIDNRKFFGLFPASGVKIALNNEYVLSQRFEKDSGNDMALDEGFNKCALSLEAQRSFFKNKIINSLDIACGGILPTGNSASLVHHMDKFYLGGLASLKGFERNAVGQHGGNFFYKLHVASSFKLAS